MYNEENERLDEILELAMASIDGYNVKIKDISHFAKREYRKLEDEFLKLRIAASNLIDSIEELDRKYRINKSRLVVINKNQNGYSDEEMDEIIKRNETLQQQLELEKAREMIIIGRRSELESSLRAIRNVAEKADRFSADCDIARCILSGNMNQDCKKYDISQTKEEWGFRIIQAQESERQRIARDMHDGPAQELSNLILKSELCLKLLDKDIDKARLELQTLKTLIRRTINDTRRLIYNLRPMSIDDLGLIPTLERLIERTEEKNDFSIELKVELNEFFRNENIPEIISLTVFRVIQEGLNNIQKHAKADRVLLDLNFNDHQLNLTLQDNGVGFDLNEENSIHEDDKGFGLQMMKERVNLLLGEFVIESDRDKGTVIHINLPIDIVEEKSKEV